MKTNPVKSWRPRLLAVSVCAATLSVLAADWPQFLGPTRDGVSTETGLVTSWPPEGPPLVWEKEVGAGYSGPVVVGARLILFHRVGGNEVVECLEADTGKRVWKFVYPSSFQDDFNKGDGPRSTPLVAGGRVYALGAEGTLHCLELDSGKKIWNRALHQEYQVPRNYFGVGTSPLLEGDLLLVNVGAKDAGIVALHKDTGKEVWRATGDGASYSSPVMANLAGTRSAIFFTRQGVVLLDPRSGAVRFQKRWRARYDASVNAATPVVVDDLVFFSASYDTGALLLHVSQKGVAEVWQGEETLSNHYNTSIQRNGYLYGLDGRQELGAQLRCVELKTGKVRWTQKDFGCAALLLAEGNLIALTEKGELVLFEANPTAYREKARAQVLSNTPCRAQIALAEGRLYARDQKKLACWNLKR